jgi:hypothetical protein
MSLITDIQQIKNETVTGANTALRVGETLEKIYKKDVLGVFRNTDGIWSPIEDTGHTSRNITGFSTPTSGANFIINHNNNYVKVLSSAVTIDDSYAKNGLFVGASIGLNASSIFIYKKGFSGLISYNASTLQWSFIAVDSLILPADLSISYNEATSILTVSHPTLVFLAEPFDIQVEQRDSSINLNTRIGSIGNTSFQFKIINYSTGALAGAPNSSFRFWFSRDGIFQVPNNRLNVGGSNIWFAGFFE